MATPGDIVIHLEEINHFDALLTEIEEKFSFFHSLLEIQRISLIERVEEAKEIYQQHQKLSEAIEQLEGVRRTTKEMLNGDLVAGNLNDVVRIYDKKLKELKRNISDLDKVSALKFLDNSEEFSKSVQRIHLREEAVEYCKRKEPLVMKGKRGFDEGEVIEPQGIAIDDTSNEVFVVDYYKDLVYVYSSEGNFIRQFGEEQLDGPSGISLSGEFLFVSNLSSSVIYKFAKTGEFVKGTSLEGENAIQLKSPAGLCVHNEFVYICNHGHNKIAVLELDLTFVENFGEEVLKYPEDIKLFKNQIFVLVHLNSTIHTFNTKHNYLRSIHFTGLQSQISHAYFFTVDNNGNFIVSDKNAGCLKLFNPSGKYVELLGEKFLSLPQGVAMDNQRRIVVICMSDYKCLQVY